eukprot:6313145-Amphidinium_carterae.1
MSAGGERHPEPSCISMLYSGQKWVVQGYLLSVGNLQGVWYIQGLQGYQDNIDVAQYSASKPHTYFIHPWEYMSKFMAKLASIWGASHHWTGLRTQEY